MIKKFMQFLEKELPQGYWGSISPDGNEITITNGGQYIYLFYKQEIEADFSNCCALGYTILDLEK